MLWNSAVNSDAILFFFAGLLTQGFILLIGRMTMKDAGIVLACALGSLLGFIPGKHEQPYDPHLHYLVVVVIFTLGYTIFLKKKVLQHINKEILLVWTLVAVYTALKIPYIVSHPQLLILLLMLSLLAVVNAFAGFDSSYCWKVYFYIWFLIVIVGIIASQFAFSTMFSILGLSFSHHSSENLEPWNMFAIGMTFLYLALNFICLVQLIPLPGKHQSIEDRLEEVEEAMDELADDYDDSQVQIGKTLALFIICAALLATNFFAQLVNDTVAISVLIAILPVTDLLLKKQPPVVATTADNPAAPGDDTAAPAEETPRRPDPPMPDEDILA